MENFKIISGLQRICENAPASSLKITAWSFNTLAFISSKIIYEGTLMRESSISVSENQNTLKLIGTEQFYLIYSTNKQKNKKK